MPQPESPAAETWTRLLVRRVAGSIGTAVVVAGVAPALANAAGAHVPNPVAIALRASGDKLASTFSADDESCGTPSPEPTFTEPAASASPSVSVSPADPSASPVESPSVSPSVAPSVAPSPECDEASPSPSASPDVSVSPSPDASESEDPETEAEDGEHGKIVSTVAHCAPRGKDPLLDVEGAPGNHGGYVRVAAHGDTLETPWGTFDLSTLAGAEQLCTALDAARATASPAAETQHGKGKSKAKKAHKHD